MTSRTQSATYRLPLPPHTEKEHDVDPTLFDDAFLGGLVLRNVRWYCDFRWLVILVFATYGALSFVPGMYASLGLQEQAWWTFHAALTLTLLNIVYLVHARALRRLPAGRGAELNLWTQIVVDLIIVSVTVHQVGSVETPIAHVYLFHIVLSCIFLPGGQSLLVTLLATLFYVSCVALETLGVLPEAGVFARPLLRRQAMVEPLTVSLHVAATVLVWWVVWYLTSHLSFLLMQRDRALLQANHRLVTLQKEKMQHMLHTTHELKAPFAAIQANTQLLQKGYCGELPAEASDVVGRIAQRSRRLAATIQEMLQLANLQSGGERPPSRQRVDLVPVLRWSVDQVKQIAAERSIEIVEDIEECHVCGVPDHLKMLFMNLLANATYYSYPNGTVHLRAHRLPDESAITVAVEDHGIGIPADKLPHVFEEYYHTNEAVRHNPNSTGLGLAIVNQIARMHGLHLSVSSTPGEGTTVTVRVPVPLT